MVFFYGRLNLIIHFQKNAIHFENLCIFAADFQILEK